MISYLVYLKRNGQKFFIFLSSHEKNSVSFFMIIELSAWYNKKNFPVFDAIFIFIVISIVSPFYHHCHHHNHHFCYFCHFESMKNYGYFNLIIYQRYKNWAIIFSAYHLMDIDSIIQSIKIWMWLDHDDNSTYGGALHIDSSF